VATTPRPYVLQCIISDPNGHMTRTTGKNRIRKNILPNYVGREKNHDIKINLVN
jgi:hypothetical protein